MPLDTFICGSCHVTFNDIEHFIVHKRDGCGAQEGVDENLGQSVTYTVQMEGVATTEADGNFTTPEGQDITTVVFPTGGEEQSQMVELSTPDMPEADSSEGPYSQTLLIVTTASQKKTTGKKRGRGKKKEPPPKQPEKLPLPDKSTDGKYHCKRCKKAFGKERHFLTHRCMAASDYVDISKRDVVKLEGDEDGDEDEDDINMSMEVEDSDEYKLPATVTNEDGELEEKGETTPEAVSNILVTDGDTEALVDKSSEIVQDLPIFNNTDEKTAFEESLNVDLSGLDGMFRVHMIEQDLNENASQPSRHSGSNCFFLYSCKTCTKVFKTLSHMRLHCLIHTKLKPFKCTKCDYTCNSKGNLYTHMRKHTGQFYTCSDCDFKTVNKSHLIEHKSTHSLEKHQCEMCKKDYKTVKSLINHIRKYHSSKRGKEYLQRFTTGRQSRGMTIIHQCHVCNRKFKKKIDRDRHLFTHDIKDTPNVKHCELCDYSASRRVYLENHFLKHRVVYQCCECPKRFLSSIRLIDHLSSQHGKDNSAVKWEALFEKCIDCSYFLPEPGLVTGQSESMIVNLPSELSSESTSALSGLQGSDSNSYLTVTDNGETTEAGDAGQTETLSADMISGNDEEVSTTEKTANKENSEEETAKNKAAEETRAEDRGVNVSAPDRDKTGEATEVESGLHIADTEGQADKQTVTPVDAKAGGQALVKQPGKKGGKRGKNKSAVKVSVDESDESGDGLAMKETQETETDLITRLGFRQMNMKIFHKMRETFGEEECEYCGRLFFNKCDYEPHLRTHTGDKPWSCDKCSYRAITKDNLKRHVEREHEKVTFPCAECEFIATSRTQLWSHQLKHKGMSTVECPVCKETFETLKDLTAHGTASHPDVPEMDWQKTQGYVQKAQGKMGRRSYKCPYCEKVFFRASSELQKHLWIHQGIKPFKCPLCPYACRSNNNLQAHMLRHSSDKPFLCTECGKAYKSRTALLWHTRSHKGGKLFKCDRCPYEGSQKSHLNRHMETHNVQKRFACDHCEFSSNTIGYMKTHYSRQHRGKVFHTSQLGQVARPTKATPAETKVYRCLSCDYLFGNLSDMKRHLKERHHVLVDNIYRVDTPSLGFQQETTLQPDATPQQTNVQVVQIEGQDSSLTPSEQDAGAALQALQNAGTFSVPSQDMDEKTASAVNILQQIIDMSQQGAFGQQQITVQAEDGQMLDVDPETIIVQQAEEVVMSSDGTPLEVDQQYVIQYVTPEDIIAQEGGPRETQVIQTQEAASHESKDIATQEVIQEGVHPEPQNVILHQVSEDQSIISQEGLILEPQTIESVAMEIVADQEVATTV
ncbi:zinc finger protein ZFAT-like isoform X2 [Liolophura sinensis]